MYNGMTEKIEELNNSLARLTMTTILNVLTAENVKELSKQLFENIYIYVYDSFPEDCTMQSSFESVEIMYAENEDNFWEKMLKDNDFINMINYEMNLYPIEDNDFAAQEIKKEMKLNPEFKKKLLSYAKGMKGKKIVIKRLSSMIKELKI